MRALARSCHKAESLRHCNAELVEGSLSSPNALARFVAGADAVIHCAGAVRGRTLDDFHPANVAGMDNLLAALHRHNPSARLLSLSSLAARQPELSPYAVSKQLGEAALVHGAGSLRYSIIRPPAVYGPSDQELLPFFKAMKLGMAPIPGSVDGRVSLIFVDDLVRAMIAWLESAEVSPGIFTVADPTIGGYSWRDICQIAGTVFHRSVRPLPVPRWLLDSVTNSNAALAKMLGYAPMLTPGKLRELRHPDWVCDNTAFTQATGWQPQIGFAKGLALTLGLASEQHTQPEIGK